MLGELARNGYDVPAGYALPASRFESFLGANGFPFALQDVAACSPEARELVAGYSLEPDMEDLQARYPEDRVIVRTSALCEDRREGSMAGAFASFAGLVTLAEVLEAVGGCYGSLLSDSVLNRNDAGLIAEHQFTAGVIIQRHVAEDISGVVFAADVKEMNAAVVAVSALRGPCSGLTDGTAPAMTYSHEARGAAALACDHWTRSCPGCSRGLSLAGSSRQDPGECRARQPDDSWS